jgi:MFS family permease
MAESGEFRRGWKVVLAAALGVGTGLSPIPFYTIGVFIGPLAREFGWTATQILQSLVFTTLAVLVASPICGILTDRYGVRRIALLSTVGFGLCFIPFALNPGHLWLLYLNYAVLSLIGVGTLPITWTRAVNNRFRKRRGLALGLSLLLTGVFGSIAKLYANWMVEQFGWRLAYCGLALFPLAISLPVALAFFHDADEPLPADEAPPPAEGGMTLRQALTMRGFWTIWIALLLLMLPIGGIIPNLEPLLGSKGFDRGTAVRLAAVIGFSVLIGRPVGGWLIDRFWAPGVAFLLLTPPGIAFLLLSHVTLTAPLAWACVFMIGFAAGLEYDVVAYLVSRYFGMRAYSAVYGSLYMAFALGSGFGPAIIARFFTAEGSYDGVLTIGAGLVLVGSSILLTLGRYPVYPAISRPAARPSG